MPSRLQYLNHFLVPELAIALSACGGDGGTGPAPDPPPTTRTFVLIDSVVVEGTGGFFMGAAAGDLSLIAIGPYVDDPTASPLFRFYDATGHLLATHNVGASVWAVAMTPDGSRTVASSDDGKLYVFHGTALVASGQPVPRNPIVRGVGISDDGRYAAAGAAAFSLHDLTAADPIVPIFVDTEGDQVRAVDFSRNNRYVAYGGQRGWQTGHAVTLMNVYDLARRQRVYHDSIPCECDNAEMRMLSISSDGNRIIGGDWAGRLHYYIREDTAASWRRVQTIEMGDDRVYWTDMTTDNSLAVVSFQGHGVHLYRLGPASMTELWSNGGPGDRLLNPPFDGASRTVTITPDGKYITTGGRGGFASAGTMHIFDQSGNLIFGRTAYPRQPFVPGQTLNEVWFHRLSNDGTRAVFASWSGVAYFFRWQ